MATVQAGVDKLRVILGETNPLNSRWQDDPHLLYYHNLGRREFSKQSKAVKAEFTRTTGIGATLGNVWARYNLDPTLYDIDTVDYDGHEVERAATQEWDEQTFGQTPDQQGIPYIYRRVGDAIDLFFAPNEAKVLTITGAILTTDHLLLTPQELELNEDQLEAANQYAAYRALTDDDRDGSLYLASFERAVKAYNRIQNAKGPRYVNLLETPKWKL